MPVIAVWDDHDLINGIWREGASAHDAATEGPFTARRVAAMQAFFEWLPSACPTRPCPSASTGALTLAAWPRCTCWTPAPSAAMPRPRAPSTCPAPPPAQPARCWVPRNRPGCRPGWNRPPPPGRCWARRCGWHACTCRSACSTTSAKPASRPTWRPRPRPRRCATTRSVRWWRSPGRRSSPTPGTATPPRARRCWPPRAALSRNLVTLAGDSHNAWAADLQDASGTAVGVEFATPSVTSAGLEAGVPAHRPAVPGGCLHAHGAPPALRPDQ